MEEIRPEKKNENSNEEYDTPIFEEPKYTESEQHYASDEEYYSRRAERIRIAQERRHKQLMRRIIVLGLIILAVIAVIVILVANKSHKSADTDKVQEKVSVQEEVKPVDTTPAVEEKKEEQKQEEPKPVEIVKPDAPAGTEIPEEQLGQITVDDYFYMKDLDESIMGRINGFSYSGMNANQSQLIYLRVLHKNAEGRTFLGELIINRDLGQEMIDIFKELYAASYPIDHLILVDEYQADEALAMDADNSWAYNDNPNTVISGAMHTCGLAININPLYNPYVMGDGTVEPASGAAYADRSLGETYMITEGDACYNAFVNRGYLWGGSWGKYYYFEKQ